MQLEDKELLDFLLAESPSASLGELQEKLSQLSGTSVSTATISRYLTKRKFSRKVLIRPARERFTDENMLYTQAFINALNRQDVSKIKFFDESGFAIPDVTNPRYGHAMRGERAIEIFSNRRTSNKTLNLLIGVNGVSYANVLDGPSDSDTFMQFFFSAINSTNNNGDLSLKPGDMVVVDNCPIHHGRSEEILSVFLHRHSIEYIFTPTYSPHLNPAELAFQHIKTLFRNKTIRHVAKENLDYAIMYCVNMVLSELF